MSPAGRQCEVELLLSTSASPFLRADMRHRQVSERDGVCPHPLPLLSLQPPFLGEGSLQCSDTAYGQLTGVCYRDSSVNTGVENTSLTQAQTGVCDQERRVSSSTRGEKEMAWASGG